MKKACFAYSKTTLSSLNQAAVKAEYAVGGLPT